MSNNFPSWLTKQMVRGVRGFNLDAYLVALEGWRRGLSLTWYLDPSKVTDLKIIGFNPLGKAFSLSSDNKTHYFYRSRGDKVANKAVEIGTDKQATKELLSKAGVPVPEGRGFKADASIDEIVNYGLSLGFPLVVKPTFGSLGKGVSTNITTEEQLRQAIVHTREIGYGRDVIVERYFRGDDYRVYVVDDQVVGVTQRLPANVVGDGRNSIEQLIEMKNEHRKENPYLSSKLIKIDDELKKFIHKKGLTLQDIPPENERVYVKEVANISAGGDPVEAMDVLSSEVKDIAVKTVQAIPGLKHAGLDMLVNGSDCTVIEVNSTADISMHIFPMNGQARNIPEAIVDHYFPDTVGMASNNKKLYFDYRSIRRLLRRGLVQEYYVTDAPSSKLYAKRYVVSGKVQKVSYRRWVRKQALRRNLHGYTRNLRDGKVVVVVGGEKEKVNNFKKVCRKGSSRARVEDVQEYVWESQIKAGFEVRKSRF